MSEIKNRIKVDVVDVVRHGKKIVVPEGMPLKRVAQALIDKEASEEESIEMHETINSFIWDGALALIKAMEELYGYAKAETVKNVGFFGTKETKPKMISIETGVNETTLVPWGRFSLPGIEGWVETSYDEKNGRVIFSLNATVKRKYEANIHELVTLTKKFAKEQSIYRGQAFKLSFYDGNGNRTSLPMPSFLDLSGVKEEEVIFSDEVEKTVSTNLFTPIEKVEMCRKHKVPLKRGILLSGPYGCGKTLVAYATAAKCVKNGWTFLYVQKADELAEIVRFAHEYQPVVVFCEDIDRVMAGERDVQIDDILNIIDGIESKNTEIMVILTTNHVEKITKAMLRPGRLDAVINVLPPDAKAVERLVRLYARDRLPEEESLEEVGKLLTGKIPAVIRECVERSKLSAIKSSKGESLKITKEDLIDAAIGMKNQMDLLDNKIQEKLPVGAEIGIHMARVIKDVVNNRLESTDDIIDDVHDHVS